MQGKMNFFNILGFYLSKPQSAYKAHHSGGLGIRLEHLEVL